MKMKNLLILFILLVLLVGNSYSQIINGDFEIVKSNFLPSNWGKNFIVNLEIDALTGQSTSDQIQFTAGCLPSLCFSTMNSWDTSTPSYALKIANAYNFTRNEIIVGGAVLFEDEIQDFPPGGEYDINTSYVPFNVSLFNTYYGLNIGFNYKFNALGNDIGEAKIEFFDEEKNSLGLSRVPLYPYNNANFNYIYAPLNVSTLLEIAFMSLSFSMAQEGSTPTFGSTLIVDDVFINNMTLGTVMNQTSSFSIYPTVTKNEINVKKGNKVSNGIYDFKIMNTEGKLVKEVSLNLNENETKIDVSQLSSGMYFLKSENFVGKFIKE